MLGRRKRVPPRVVLTLARRVHCVGIRVACPDLPFACFAATRASRGGCCDRAASCESRRVVGLESPAGAAGRVWCPGGWVEEKVARFDRSARHRLTGVRES